MTVSLPKETVKVLAELLIIKMIKEARKAKTEDDVLAKDIITKLIEELKFDVVDDDK